MTNLIEVQNLTKTYTMGDVEVQALTSEQRQRVAFPIDAEEWRMWINVHMNHFRHGVMLEDLGGGNYLRYLHEGSFDHLDESHDVMFRELLAHPEWQLRDAPILHEYLTDPDETPEADLRTHIYMPVA